VRIVQAEMTRNAIATANARRAGPVPSEPFLAVNIVVSFEAVPVARECAADFEDHDAVDERRSPEQTLRNL